MRKKPPEQSKRVRGNNRSSLSVRLESVRYLNSSSARRRCQFSTLQMPSSERGMHRWMNKQRLSASIEPRLGP